MPGPESTFWRSIHNQTPWFKRRIENLVGSGVFDVFMIIDGVSVWMELKSLDRFARDLKIHPLQREFGREVMRAGGLAYVLVKVKVPDPFFLLIRGDNVLKDGDLVDWVKVSSGRWHGAIDWNDFKGIVLNAG